MKYIDLRSDTVTHPTEEMRQAMRTAEVGDDVYGEDPTTLRLEELTASMMGKEAALFVPSGTMGNQIAIMAQTRPGDELIAAAGSHIANYEAGGAARLSGVTSALVDNQDGRVYPEDIRRLVRDRSNVHFPRTRLVCMENAQSNGGVIPVEQMRQTLDTAREYGLLVHLDGARIFNAALALGTTAAEVASCADTVMLCVSKGLCAPAGSLICGSGEFIAEARRCRKLLGGGMRQTGVLAACGIIALEEMTGRLRDDHNNARYLGELLSWIPGIRVDLDSIKINMVFWECSIPGFDTDEFVAFMLERGIKTAGTYAGAYRFLTNRDVSRQDVETAAEAVRAYVETLAYEEVEIPLE